MATGFSFVISIFSKENFTVSDGKINQPYYAIFIWLQLTLFISSWWIYGLSNHFHSKNLEIQGNLC